MTLDEVVPHPQYRMCHARSISAPPTAVWDELGRVTMSALPLGYVLESIRLLPAWLIGRRHQQLAGRTFLDVTPIPVLFCRPPQVVISAGLSQAWRLLGGPVPPRLDAAALRAWSQPGWIKVAMEFPRRTHRGGHPAEHRDPRYGDGPQDAAVVRAVLVLHPPGQQRDPPRGIESRLRPRGVAAHAARPNGERLKHPRKGR